MSREPNEGEHSNRTSPLDFVFVLPLLFERVLNDENIKSTAEEGRTFLVSGREPGWILK